MATSSLKILSGVALIVTTSSGIGLAVGRRLANDGAAAINFHCHLAPALALADEVRWRRALAIAVGANVTDESRNQH
jgi:NAD(P)-dependent dehydrogenase (short-subunit alcohol dehydrogenase family)